MCNFAREKPQFLLRKMGFIGRFFCVCCALYGLHSQGLILTMLFKCTATGPQAEMGALGANVVNK